MALQTVDSVITSSQEPKKCFLTFPYPYVNGRLHLGHGYTLSKLVYLARYKMVQGYDVLFPFGFHGTGTPIVSCAEKLRQELERGEPPSKREELSPEAQPNEQCKLLENGVDLDEIPKFVNPEHWIHYFSAKAKEDLRLLDNGGGPLIDFNRSFFTTNLNPYYDKFVKWQFRKLQEKGYLVFGKYPIIFCPVSQQPCSDHDRQTGEGVKPVQRKLAAYTSSDLSLDGHPKDRILIVSYNDLLCQSRDLDHKNADQRKEHLVLEYKYVSPHNSFCFLTEATIGRNWEAQEEGVKMFPIEKVVVPTNSLKRLFGVQIGDRDDSTLLGQENYGNEDIAYLDYEDSNYWEPESKVITRFGGEAVVKKVDQWFIDYGNRKWKTQAYNFITDDLEIEGGLRRMMSKTCLELDLWPFTRSKGLGTEFVVSAPIQKKCGKWITPGGTGLIIDSLSDSTIYQALYTIYDLLTEIPEDQVTDELFDRVFLGSSDPDYKNLPIGKFGADSPTGEFYRPQDEDPRRTALIGKMREQFLYWYPVDVVCSAGDLVNNHMIMSVYHHLAIWGTSGVCPKRMNINGYLTLNGKKMSKSNGNFLTLEGCLGKYGSPSVLLTFADTIDGTADANFSETFCEAKSKQLSEGRFSGFPTKLAEIKGRAATGTSTSAFLDSVIHDLVCSQRNDFISFCEASQFRMAVTLYYGYLNVIDLLHKLPHTLRLSPETVREVELFFHQMSYVFLGDYYAEVGAWGGWYPDTMKVESVNGDHYYYPIVTTICQGKYQEVTFYRQFSPEKVNVIARLVSGQPVAQIVSDVLDKSLLPFAKFMAKRSAEHLRWTQLVQVDLLVEFFDQFWEGYTKVQAETSPTKPSLMVEDVADAKSFCGPDSPKFVK